MEAYQQRVVDEKTELDSKIGKLSAFTVTLTFASVVREERNRLIQQLDVMRRYSEILGERIAAF